MREYLFSFFKRVTSPRPQKSISLSEFITNVRCGDWADQVNRVRGVRGKEEANQLKVICLPAIKPSGTFTASKAASLVNHSGLLCLDFDELNDHLAEFRERVIHDPHVCAVFVSPRGKGLKVFVPTAATDAESHRISFELARRYFVPIMPPGALLDSHPTNVAANCFVGHDEQAWLAETDREVFPASDSQQGCRIDIRHVVKTTGHDVESLEKESSLSSSSFHEGIGAPAGEQGYEPDSNSTASRAPIPAAIHLPGVVGNHVWQDWVYPHRHQAARRNEFIVGRVPILLNLVSPETTALLLLRWYREAPKGLFKDSEQTHWTETWSHVHACLASWPDHKSKFALNDTERSRYLALPTDRQKTAFRICRSLSLAKPNIQTRSFFLSDQDCADRLLCPGKSGERQLNYLVRAGIIEVVAAGNTWRKGVPATATRYRWCL